MRAFTGLALRRPVYPRHQKARVKAAEPQDASWEEGRSSTTERPIDRSITHCSGVEWLFSSPRSRLLVERSSASASNRSTTFSESRSRACLPARPTPTHSPTPPRGSPTPARCPRFDWLSGIKQCIQSNRFVNPAARAHPSPISGAWIIHQPPPATSTANWSLDHHFIPLPPNPHTGRQASKQWTQQPQQQTRRRPWPLPWPRSART